MGREEELEEEGGKMDGDEGESEEGGRAKDTLEGRRDGDTARGATTESVALMPRDR